MKLGLLVGILLTLSASSYGVDCNTLSFESSVLCKQNKRILRKLNMLSNGGSTGDRICEIRYCSYNGKVENRPEYVSQCDNATNIYWKVKSIDVEARNRVHAREVFRNSNLPVWDSRQDITIGFVSASCQ